MSAINSMLSHLLNGNQITAAQARSMFKVDNVADVVYRLRNEGVVVYTNRYTTSRGRKTFAYRLGSPSQRYLNSIESRHKARARQALYTEALRASNG